MRPFNREITHIAKTDCLTVSGVFIFVWTSLCVRHSFMWSDVTFWVFFFPCFCLASFWCFISTGMLFTSSTLSDMLTVYLHATISPFSFKVVYCSCVSHVPCSSIRYTCKSRKLPCTIWCVCHCSINCNNEWNQWIRTVSLSCNGLRVLEEVM